MGSVPNCEKEIANRYSIRWFKCKLKPPKKPDTMRLIDNYVYFDMSHMKVIKLGQKHFMNIVRIFDDHHM